MTLSGFSLRPLVFITPWTNKPVHNHTHRYTGLIILSCLLCTPRDLNRWQRQTILCVKKGKAQLEKRLQYQKKKTNFFFFLRKQQHPQRHAEFLDCNLSLNFSPSAPCWRAASTESLPIVASGENTFPAPIFLDGGIQIYSLVCHISKRNMQSLPVLLCWMATLS